MRILSTLCLTALIVCAGCLTSGSSSHLHPEFERLFAPYAVAVQGNTVIVTPRPNDAYADPTGPQPFPFTGQIDSMHETGHLAIRLRYVSGEVHGERTEYYRNGALQDRRYYRHGVLVGTRRWWFPNGAIWGEEHYVDGKLHGRKVCWHMEGTVAIDELYEHGELKEPTSPSTRTQ